MRMWAGGFLTGELVRLCPKNAIGTRGGHTVDDANRTAFDRAADLGVAAAPLTFVIRPRRVRPCFAVKRGGRRCAHEGGAEREFMRATPVLFLVRPLGLPIPEVLRAIVPPLLDHGRHISGALRRRARRHRWRRRHRRRRRRPRRRCRCRRRCRRRWRCRRRRQRSRRRQRRRRRRWSCRLRRERIRQGCLPGNGGDDSGRAWCRRQRHPHHGRHDLEGGGAVDLLHQAAPLLLLDRP
mmetsp:Transcript_6708/g.25154  ORF Transcript_6708/g.25154 Transcript_6708/m.25154 type:complete len:238 (+) Transcript_6708:1650-2363(+)